jgi:hypothetical protein
MTNELSKGKKYGKRGKGEAFKRLTIGIKWDEWERLEALLEQRKLTLRQFVNNAVETLEAK